MKARREAMLADVVVVNHHLFFADMALRDSGVAELLPSVEVAIFDEAHQLAEAGVQFLGTTLGSAQLIDFARDMLAVGLQQARGLAPWQELAAACDHAARELRLAAQRRRSATSAAASSCAGPSAAATTRFRRRARRASAKRATAAAAALDTVSEIAPDFVRLARARRAASPSSPASSRERPQAGHIRWIDLLAHQARLVESPLDIRDALREQMAKSAKAWIFTSATLGDDDRLSWFTEPAGLDDARVVRLGSPFDYARARARLRAARCSRSRASPAMPTRSPGSPRAARARSAAAPSC